MAFQAESNKVTVILSAGSSGTKVDVVDAKILPRSAHRTPVFVPFEYLVSHPLPSSSVNTTKFWYFRDRRFRPRYVPCFLLQDFSVTGKVRIQAFEERHIFDRDYLKRSQEDCLLIEDFPDPELSTFIPLIGRPSTQSPGEKPLEVGTSFGCSPAFES